MEYTKGEWKIHLDNEGGLHINSESIWIAKIYGTTSLSEDKTNANLIASAPKMHEALMEFPNYVTSSTLDAEQILERIREWRNKYWHPAMDKAEGKKV